MAQGSGGSGRAAGDGGGETAARLARVERIAEALATTQRDVLDRLDVQYELLRRVVAAVEREAPPGPSPVAAELRAMVQELRAQTALLLRAVPGGTDTAGDGDDAAP